jgi:hypothetical protein
MSEKLILNDGLRIGKKELTLLQDQVLLNLSRLFSIATSIPPQGAVLTTRTAAGVLGSELRVDVVGNVPTVRLGTGITSGISYINVPADTTNITGTFANSTSRWVVAHAATTTLEAGTVSVAAGGGTATFSSSAAAALYAGGDYLRLSGSGSGNNGTFRIGSISGVTATMAETIGAGTAEAGLLHSQAGKFFPGYPLAGTTDVAQHDSYTLTYEDPATYAVTTSDLRLATLAKNGSGTITITTDDRQVFLPRLGAFLVSDAVVSTTAAIAESKIALSVATQEAQSKRHDQNTDAYTSSTTFRVKGVAGPRVLTEEDLPVLTPKPPQDASTTLTAEPNLAVSFEDILAWQRGPLNNLLFAPRIPSIKVSWGVNGNADSVTGSGTSRTVTINAAHNLLAGTTVAVNGLANYLLRDSAGNLFRITANTAANPGASFTVTVSTPSTVPVTGAARIHSTATALQVVIKETGTNNVFSYDIGPDSAGLLPGAALPPFNGKSGVAYDVTLISFNARTVPTSVSVSKLAVKWGSNGDVPTSALNVDPNQIAVVTDQFQVNFAWPHPAGFDVAKHNYLIAHTSDGSTPTIFDRPAAESSTGGAISFYASSYNTIRIKVRVVDMSGTVLSTVDAAADGTAINTYLSGNLQTEMIPFSLTDADFTNLGDSLPTKKLRTKLFLQDVTIIGVAVTLTTMTGTGGLTVKGRAWETGIITNGVFSDPLTSLGDFLTPVMSLNIGKSIDIGLEKVTGTVTGTGVVGNILVYYREIGGTDPGGKPGDGNGRRFQNPAIY